MLNLVFQYPCGGVNVERVRGPTVSLGAVGPREFDLLTPAAQHNVLPCVILKYGTVLIDLTIPDKVFVCMVITYSRVWINRVRLPILLVVS